MTDDSGQDVVQETMMIGYRALYSAIEAAGVMHDDRAVSAAIQVDQTIDGLCFGISMLAAQSGQFDTPQKRRLLGDKVRLAVIKMQNGFAEHPEDLQRFFGSEIGASSANAN